jgi:hypothetical protein
MDLKLIIATSMAITLVACGGSGSSSNTISPTTYTPVAPKMGDTYSYNQTTTYSNGTTAQTPFTDQVAIVDNAGTFYFNEYITTTGAVLDSYHLDANRNTLKNGQCTYNPTLQNPLPTPRFVGETSNTTSTFSCPNGEVVNIQQNANILDYETITVPAGTFKTLKAQIVSTITNGNGATTQIAPYTATETCWHDIVTGFAVQCQSSRTFNPALPSSTIASVSSTSQLASISNVSQASVALTGTGSSGTPLQYLYLTPNEQANIVNVPNPALALLFNTTQPVTWKIVVGTNTVIVGGSNESISYNGVTFTASATSSSFNLTSTTNTTSTPVQAQLIATLASNPSQIMTINLTVNP